MTRYARATLITLQLIEKKISRNCNIQPVTSSAKGLLASLEE